MTNIISNFDEFHNESNLVDLDDVFSLNEQGSAVKYSKEEFKNIFRGPLLESEGSVDEITLDCNVISLFGNLFYYHLSHMLESCKYELVEKRTQHIMLLTKTNSQLFQYLQEQKKIIVKLKQYMQLYDFIIAPAVVTPSASVSNTVNFDCVDPIILNPFAVLCTVSQQPTVTVPIGLDPQSMPTSVTISADSGHDNDLLQFCKILQHQFPMPHSPFF